MMRSTQVVGCEHEVDGESFNKSFIFECTTVMRFILSSSFFFIPYLMLLLVVLLLLSCYYQYYLDIIFMFWGSVIIECIYI